MSLPELPEPLGYVNLRSAQGLAAVIRGRDERAQCEEQPSSALVADLGFCQPTEVAQTTICQPAARVNL